jgi:hypothetical protein
MLAKMGTLGTQWWECRTVKNKTKQKQCRHFVSNTPNLETTQISINRNNI